MTKNLLWSPENKNKLHKFKKKKSKFNPPDNSYRSLHNGVSKIKMNFGLQFGILLK